MYDNFLFRAKRTVYKWWCIVYKPVYKLIHNGEWPEEKEPHICLPNQRHPHRLSMQNQT